MKDIDQKYYCSSYYDVSVNKYSVTCGTLLRFWENNGWINSTDAFSGILDIGWIEDLQMIKDKLIDGKKL